MPLILVMLLSTATGFAQASPGDKATEIQYLSGTGKDDMVEWGFYCSDGRKSGSWTTIGVPSCWELQGFGAYNYGHDPFESRANEHGLYKLSFSSPKECKGKEVKIVFEGVMTDAEVKMKEKKQVTGYKGISFSFPESEVAGMKWLGDGPYRVWRNRMKGTKFQVWENDYNNTITGESGFVYPEFKGFFSSLYWAKVKGKNDNGFTVYCNSKNTFLRMLTPDQPMDPKRGSAIPEFPGGDISFVKNIPPVGTKFQDAKAMGPQGNPANYFGNDDEPIVINLNFEF